MDEQRGLVEEFHSATTMELQLDHWIANNHPIRIMIHVDYRISSVCHRQYVSVSVKTITNSY